jgi:hypothetical protein
MTDKRKTLGRLILNNQTVAEIIDWEITYLRPNGDAGIQAHVRLDGKPLGMLVALALEDEPGEQPDTRPLNERLLDAVKNEPVPPEVLADDRRRASTPEPETNTCWNCRHKVQSPDVVKRRCVACPHIDETGAKVWKLWEPETQVAPDPSPGVAAGRKCLDCEYEDCDEEPVCVECWAQTKMLHGPWHPNWRPKGSGRSVVNGRVAAPAPEPPAWRNLTPPMEPIKVSPELREAARRQNGHRGPFAECSGCENLTSAGCSVAGPCSPPEFQQRVPRPGVDSPDSGPPET